MRATLALHLSDAVRDIRQFKEGVINRLVFMTWCDQYEAQIIFLAAQIMWNKDVEAASSAMTSRNRLSVCLSRWKLLC